MSKSKSIVVGTAAIRAWAVENYKSVDAPTASLFGANGTAKAPGKVRGRIHPAFVAAFLAANPGTEFGEGDNKPAERTIALPLVSAKTGRAIKPVTVPVSEAKVLAGTPNKRGRMSSDELARAAAAYQKQG
jgi:hypothetical protein